MEEKQITIDYLKDLFRYHSEKYRKSNDELVKNHHLFAKEKIFDVMKLVGEGKKNKFKSEYYDKNNEA